MPAYAVLGAQWGDEGKGKIIDYLAKDIRPLNSSIKSKSPRPADIVVRFNGGNNAGHTVWNPLGEFKLHLIPGGIFIPTTLNVIGSECGVDPESLYNEDVENPGEFQTINKECGLTLKDLHRRLRISKKAHLVFPWHRVEDRLQEQLRGRGGLGTTKKGMGPMFTDKTARFGLRVGDLLDEHEFRRKFDWLWGSYKKNLFERFYEIPHNAIEEELGDPYYVLRQMLCFKDNFRQCFADVEPILQDAFDRDNHILFEGAQGFLLDVDHGTYPYVTSSRTGISPAYNCGITKFQEVIGVVKAYTTRVGEGPFPTEMNKERADSIRVFAKEFGATTGRPRRIGWLDIPALQYFVRMNGATRIALTRLDILDNLYGLQVGVGYNCDSHGRLCTRFECVIANKAMKSENKSMEGWGPPAPGRRPTVQGSTELEEFPQEAKEYCNFIEQNVAPLVIISKGAHRDETIVV